MQQHRPLLPGGGGNPGTGHREGTTGLDGGGLLQQLFADGHLVHYMTDQGKFLANSLCLYRPDYMAKQASAGRIVWRKLNWL